MHNKPYKLHLGCADKKMDGWINIDSVDTFQPDLIHDLNDPLPYDDQSVDDILAKDLLEHFDKYARYVVFYDWARVLKIGGRITVEVPNIKKILLRYFKFGFENFVDFLFGENMLRSEIYIGHYGNHKFGYSVDTLKTFVRTFGIEPVNVTTHGLNIQFHGEKKTHKTLEELDSIKIHSHANSFGDTPDLTLGFVRQKMARFKEMSSNNEGH